MSAADCSYVYLSGEYDRGSSIVEQDWIYAIVLNADGVWLLDIILQVKDERIRKRLFN